MTSLRVAVTAVLAGALTTCSADASILIDHFDSFQDDAAGPSGPLASTSHVLDPAVVGGERGMSAAWGGGTGGIFVTSNLNGDSAWVVDVAPGSTGIAELDWDGIDGSSSSQANGLSNLDLTAGGTLDHLEIGVLFATGTFQITIFVGSPGGAGTLSRTFTLGGPVGANSILIPFASFTQQGSNPSFTNVGNIQLDAVTTSGGTLAFDYIRAVPAPGSCVLFAAIAPVLVRRRRD